MTHTVPVVVYVTTTSQKDAERIVAEALSADERIYLAKTERTVNLVAA